MSRPLLHAFMLAALPLAAGAQALIEWKGEARYEKMHTIAPGKFAEVCTRLGAGSEVQWAFTADAAVDFNIHYHVGDRVEYAAKTEGSRRAAGTTTASTPQDYCWMWTNRGASPATLKLDLAPHR
jgi:hypothetical protein